MSTNSRDIDDDCPVPQKELVRKIIIKGLMNAAELDSEEAAKLADGSMEALLTGNPNFKAEIVETSPQSGGKKFKVIIHKNKKGRKGRSKRGGTGEMCSACAVLMMAALGVGEAATAIGVFVGAAMAAGGFLNSLLFSECGPTGTAQVTKDAMIRLLGMGEQATCSGKASFMTNQFLSAVGWIKTLTPWGAVVEALVRGERSLTARHVRWLWSISIRACKKFRLCFEDEDVCRAAAGNASQRDWSPHASAALTAASMRHRRPSQLQPSHTSPYGGGRSTKKGMRRRTRVRRTRRMKGGG
jgi:hypothetical protein